MFIWRELGGTGIGVYILWVCDTLFHKNYLYLLFYFMPVLNVAEEMFCKDINFYCFLKNHKATRPALNVGLLSARQRNAI